MAKHHRRLLKRTRPGLRVLVASAAAAFVLFSPALIAGAASKKHAVTASFLVDALQPLVPSMGGVVNYTDATDPNRLLGRPGQYASKANFIDSRTGATLD